MTDTEPVPRYPSPSKPLEGALARLTYPLEAFLRAETASGILLMAATLVALALANSALAPFYRDVLHLHVTFALGPLALDMTLHHFINDGLMALFFFVVGLEIKREFLAGHLAKPSQAVLPVAAAAGGMIAPALLYLALAGEGTAARGWGIPMATDIAFAIGVLVLLGGRVPRALMGFLLALAIVDDLGAVLVIALFYSGDLNLEALETAGGIMALLVLLNLSGVRRPLPYFLAGGGLWLAILASGIHATLAGVLTALAVPATAKLDTRDFTARLKRLAEGFEKEEKPGKDLLHTPGQYALLHALERNVHAVEPPLMRLEHILHPWVAFLVIPLFALANAGIPLDPSSLGAALAQPVSLGVMAGLVLGKPLGVVLAVGLLLGLRLGKLPDGMAFHHVIGVGLLAGIGFTMAIFIAELAFYSQPALLTAAKTGILAASLLSGILGFAWLRLLSRP